MAASFTQALAQTSVRCCCAIVRPCQFCGTSANTTSQRNRYSSTVSNGPDWPLTSRLNQCQDSLVLDVAHCCSSRAIVSTIKSFDALALPLRVPTASLPSYLPRHINAFLISSSMPAWQLVTSSNRAKRCVLYLFLSSSLLFSSSLDIPSHLLAKHLQLASYPHPSNRPPTNLPHHTTLLLFSIPQREHEVELQHARHGCRRGSGQRHAQPAPLVSPLPHSSHPQATC